jgi:hypothetical protein
MHEEDLNVAQRSASILKKNDYCDSPDYSF